MIRKVSARNYKDAVKMNAAYRTSPLYSIIAPLKPAWVDVNRMRIPLRFSDNERTVMEKLALCDLSFLSRFGVKGAGAADWLKSHCETPPADINHWEYMKNGEFVRLGSSEF
jgi:sarcosine oxidase subunit gamma